MTCREVPHFMFAPDREDCLRAVSKSLGAALGVKGVCRKRLARILGCSTDTIDAGSTEAHLISFDTIAALMQAFPDQSAPLHALWGRERAELTVDDHRAAIEHHTAALARMATEVRA